MNRLAVVVSHPIQYHTVIWRGIHESENLNIKVYFCSDHGVNPSFDKEFGISFKWDRDLLSGYPHRFTKNLRTVKNFGFFDFFNPEILLEMLNPKHPVIYFHGFNWCTHLLSFLLAKLAGKQTMLRTDSNLLTPTSKIKTLIKEISYQPLLSLFDFFLCVGEYNKEFYLRHGSTKQKIVHTPHLVDNKFFKEKRSDLLTQRNELGVHLGLQEHDKVLLFVGKLFEKKQPLVLLNAFLKADLPDDWKLLFVGTGEQEDELRALASSHSDRVLFAGFLNQDKISEAYQLSEVIVLPSQYGETWGLVINEALNFDLATIVSNRVGCAPDLVENRTGMVFNYEKEEELVRCIREITQSELLKKYQGRASQTLQKCDISYFVSQLTPIIQPYCEARPVV